MKAQGIFRAGSIAIIASTAIMLSGCGATSAASSQQSSQHVTEAGKTVVRKTEALNTPTFDARSMLTSIPKGDHYLKVTFAVKENRTYFLNIGHPLTDTGAIVPTTFNFPARGGMVTEYIPMGVVFDTVANGELFAYFPPSKSRNVNEKASSVWLLLYSDSPVTVYAMRRSIIRPANLISWPYYGSANVQNRESLRTEQTAAKTGWKLFKTIHMNSSLTGLRGVNGLVNLPLHTPVNLINAYGHGNIIFEIDGIIPASAVH